MLNGNVTLTKDGKSVSFAIHPTVGGLVMMTTTDGRTVPFGHESATSRIYILRRDGWVDASGSPMPMEPKVLGGMLSTDAAMNPVKARIP